MISKEFKDWIGAKTQLANGGSSWAWCSTWTHFRWRSPQAPSWPPAWCSWRDLVWDLVIFHFEYEAQEGAWDHQSSCATINPRRSSARFWHQCNPLILGSPLQWRWQWTSIGHFVFLFSWKFHSYWPLIISFSSNFSTSLPFLFFFFFHLFSWKFHS